MVERGQVVDLWRESTESVLITVVRVEGSSYRRPGARMLVASTSGTGARHAGTLSGGCLEAEVQKKAQWMVRGGALVERYSTMFDDTGEIPFGLGCGGTVDLLLEPAEAPEGRALLEAMALALEGVPATVVSWLPFDGLGLRRVILDVGGEVIFRSDGLSELQIAEGRAFQSGAECFVERLEAPHRLFVIGAGDDARPLVQMAAAVGFAVTVVDARSRLATKERFPAAAEVLVCDGDSEELRVGAGDSAVIMTHSYEQDRKALARLLPLSLRYLGLLGAKHRSSLLVSEVAATLKWSVGECCERLFAPVGMDLGGDGPEAVALAIVAEVHGVVHERVGQSLRLNEREIGEQLAKGSAAIYTGSCSV